MEYGKIIAVTGLPGLFELLSSKNDGAIVRSLEDKTTRFVSSRVHNFSHLESIEVFTVKDNVNLVDIFQAMEKNGGKIPDGKDTAALKAYFQKVYPDLDFERVYTSDLKKMIKWFDVLKENKIEIRLTEQPDSDTPAEATTGQTPAAPVEDAAEPIAESKSPAPKKTAKKKAAPAAKADEAEEKPAKKAPAKKAPAKKK